MKPYGRLCSFSPCIEQVVATAKTMTERGFMDIQVVECNERRFVRKRLREELVDAASNVFNSRTVFQGGQKEDKTHTGYLLFGTWYPLD